MADKHKNYDKMKRLIVVASDVQEAILAQVKFDFPLLNARPVEGDQMKLIVTLINHSNEATGALAGALQCLYAGTLAERIVKVPLTAPGSETLN